MTVLRRYHRCHAGQGAGHHSASVPPPQVALLPPETCFHLRLHHFYPSARVAFVSGVVGGGFTEVCRARAFLECRWLRAVGHDPSGKTMP